MWLLYIETKANEENIIKGISFTANLGERIGIVGGSGSGKTTNVLNCIANSNCKYMTEDLIVLNRKDYTVMPINKPAGIRYKSLDKVNGLKKKVESENNKRIFHSNVTGKIFVVKISDLFKNSFCSVPSIINKFVILNNNANIENCNFKKVSNIEAIKALIPHRFTSGEEEHKDLRDIVNISRICDIWTVDYNLENVKHRNEVRKFISEEE